MTGSVKFYPKAVVKSACFALISVLLLLSLSSCSGGGGSSSSGRTRETAVRIVHASIDTTPLDIVGPEGFIQSARFNQATDYVPIKDGAITLVLSRARVPQVVAATFSETLKKNMEYSVFVYGEASDVLRKEIIEDIVQEPSSGNGMLRFMNGYSSNSRLLLQIDGADWTPVLQLGGHSDFAELPAGEHSYAVRSEAGKTVSSGLFTLDEGSELTVVISGSAELAVAFVTFYTDLD